jgi:hypothetical protein
LEGALSKKVTKITAVGTRGDAAGKLFTAKPDASGRYVLNKKAPATSADPTNKAVNKVYARDLDEALRLLTTDHFLINLISNDGKRALRELKKVRIEWSET